MRKYAIVLAAGKGTRMKTELPKCAYPLLRKPMIAYIVENLKNTGLLDELIVVVGHKKEIMMDILNDTVTYAVQEEQLGTGHAVKMAKDKMTDMDGFTIILPGDMPLINETVIAEAINDHKEYGNDLTVVTTIVDDPFGYGRIIRNGNDSLDSIIEENDATNVQKAIKEINTGIYIIKNNLLFQALDQVTNDNSKGEYYLTDIVKILKNENANMGTYVLKTSYKAMGVNDLYALSVAEGKLRNDINRALMIKGVAMINPETITIGHNVVIEENVTIHPNTYITGNSIVKKGAQIGPNTEIHNSEIGESVVCKHSLVYNSRVQEYTTVGPFAHLRDGADIGPRNRIGNFVEIKKSSTGENTKASHLAYIGDAEIGNHVNFGCGAITVNYDGSNKYKTIIGDNVFVGCNVNLIAPIEVHDDSFIAAGSTLNKNVPKGTLAIARAYQVNKENYMKLKKDQD
ncbi:MAG: bifunctional UDP-N-acetylglucosamine diphosphorylase/glucosamine-1-phosphate N-acetyltransferase GlmU [Bacilli bacterium]|nr:bifunctional UDP-N-acetylglucosamine diphosphorylase/glucosamine-1-phosphate N-acetyltransferase GlmU [Bacilli bacterium]MBN2877375.1 bifunctional UDP-N-acetylglucosamine diphosphorylase/glucosamine-1-phosphate N-acetyltransferase GlmU [Bacilli bacterium]